MDELRKELREIFNRAIDMPPNNRAAYLDSADEMCVSVASYENRLEK